MHTAPRATPTPMPALAPVLSPESEFGVDDDDGVEETLLAIGLDCVVEEDGDDGNEDDEEDDAPGDADVVGEVEAEVDAKSANFPGAGAWKVSLVGALQSVVPVSVCTSQQCQRESASMYMISGSALPSVKKKQKVLFVSTTSPPPILSCHAILERDGKGERLTASLQARRILARLIRAAGYVVA